MTSDPFGGKSANPKVTARQAKCPRCNCWTMTYSGNKVNPPLGRRFCGHAKDGGPALRNFDQTYCFGSYQLVPEEEKPDE